MALSIELNQDQERKLGERASALNLKPEELAQAAVKDLVSELKGNGNKWFFPLGAPIRKRHRLPYQLALDSRFKDKRVGVDFVHRILDRQINKARGLLTFNALLFTAINTTILASAPRNQIPVFPVSSRIALVLSLGSCLPLLATFYLSWGTAQNLRDDESDFSTCLIVLRKRTYLLTISLYATLVATFITLWLVVR